MLFRSLLISFVLAAAAGTTYAGDTLELVEQAAEVESLIIQRISKNSGVIKARVCDECEQRTLRVTSETLVFMRDKPATLRDAYKNQRRGATVMFYSETSNVSRIVFW